MSCTAHGSSRDPRPLLLITASHCDQGHCFLSPDSEEGDLLMFSLALASSLLDEGRCGPILQIWRLC